MIRHFLWYVLHVVINIQYIVEGYLIVVTFKSSEDALGWDL